MTDNTTWLQLVVDTTEQAVDQISDTLLALGALSITLQDAADQPVYEPALNTTPLWQQTQVIGLFNSDTDMNALEQRMKQLLDPLPVYNIVILADQEWTRVWMRDFHPMRFGQHLWICPSWEQPPDSDAINILLDPGLAFGTGTHPTTALCLEWLDAQSNLAGQTVIDYGCGSGILAIAAAKLGATTVWCVDNDPQALLATQENAKKNNVEKQLHTYLPAELPRVRANILLANILANPLIMLADHFAQCVQTTGLIVLSGILQEQADEVVHCYQTIFTIMAVSHQENWVRIVAQKN